MTKRKDYVDMELDLAEGQLEQWIAEGFVCRRGNQHGTRIYFTELGQLALTQYSEKIIKAAEEIRIQDEWFDKEGVPQSERNYRG